jgi:hypothetical protein
MILAKVSHQMDLIFIKIFFLGEVPDSGIKIPTIYGDIPPDVLILED